MFDDEMAEGYRETQDLMKRYNLPYEQARQIVTGNFQLISNGVLQDWTVNIPRMQQSVLLSAIRCEDGTPKFHQKKQLIRWYRRCVLKSAFTGEEIISPSAHDGGSFTGAIDDEKEALNSFLQSRDDMTLHYYMHCMHAFEIVGYKHSVPAIREFWHGAYLRMVNVMHVYPETEDQMDRRLGDNVTGWKERNDPSGTCTD